MAGIALAFTAWLVFVPWDMSTVGEAGRRIAGRSDAQTGPKIGLALALILVVALVVEVRRGDARPLPMAAAGAATWAVLFAWRAAVSRVGGANFWPIAFVFIVAPAAVLGPALVIGIAGWIKSGARPPWSWRQPRE